MNRDNSSPRPLPIRMATSGLCALLLVLGAACGGDEDAPTNEAPVKKLKREGDDKDNAGGSSSSATQPAVSRKEAARQAELKILAGKLEKSDDPDDLAEYVAEAAKHGTAAKGLWKQVLKVAESEEAFTRAAAVAAAAKINPANVRPLLEKALADDDAEVRKTAVAAWAEAEIPELEPLIQRVADELDPQVQFAIMRVVETSAKPHHKIRVMKVADDLHPSALKPMVKWLVKIKATEESERIAGYLEKNDSDLRVMSARTLAEFGSKTKPVLLALVRGLSDEESKVRLAAFEALKKLTGQSLAFDPAGPEEDRSAEAKSWREWVEKNG